MMKTNMKKYMKIMMDKVMEYMMKILNEAMSPIISALPSSMRFMMLDLKETIVELIRCLYCKITDGLFGMLEGILSKAFDISALEQIARNPNTAGTSRKNPKVPVCYAECVVGQALAGNASSILNFSDGLLDNVNTFMFIYSREHNHACFTTWGQNTKSKSRAGKTLFGCDGRGGISRQATSQHQLAASY